MKTIEQNYIKAI